MRIANDRHFFDWRHPRYLVIGGVFCLVGIGALIVGIVTGDVVQAVLGAALIFNGVVFARRVQPAVRDGAFVVPNDWRSWQRPLVPATDIAAVVIPPPEGRR